MLLTLAGQSGFRQTGRLDEVEALCEAFAARWPDSVHSFVYGHSAEGPTNARIAGVAHRRTDVAGTAPQRCPDSHAQGGIHPGESDGKDAGFIALREILDEPRAPDLLERIAVLFVPAFNTDGHERVGRWNRPDQNGPEVTGWRTTAQNVNLNRDYTKAATPEMQAMLRMIDEWDPLICADLHVTDGADFEPDISIQVEPINQGAPNSGKAASCCATGSSKSWRHRAHCPAVLSRSCDDRRSFLRLRAHGVFAALLDRLFPPAQSLHGAGGDALPGNRIPIVRITRNTIIGLAEITAEHGAAWLREVQRADASASRLGGSEVVHYASGWRGPSKAGASVQRWMMPARGRIDFRGYAYTREPSAISGALVTIYDPRTPQIWNVPYRDRVQPALIVTAPAGGYLVPPSHAALVQASCPARNRISCAALLRLHARR